MDVGPAGRVVRLPVEPWVDPNETFALQLKVDTQHERVVLWRAVVVIELLALLVVARQVLLGLYW